MSIRKLMHTRLNLSFTSGELRAWLYGSFGLMLMLVICTAMTLHSFVSHDKYIIIILFLVITPCFTYFIVVPSSSAGWLFNRRLGETLLFLNLLFILVGSLWYGAPSFLPNLSLFNPINLSLVYLGVLFIVFIIAFLRRNSTIPFGLPWAFVCNKILLLVTPVTLVAVTIAPHQWYISGSPLYTFHKVAAMWWSLLLVFTIIFWRLRLPLNSTRPAKILTWLVSAAVFIAPFAMMDAWFSYDALHYTAYLGPATAVIGGRIPLLGVFSQYGQSYLMYNLGFLFLPHTYYAAALITTFLNALPSVPATMRQKSGKTK